VSTSVEDTVKNGPRARLEQREADILDAATTLFAAEGFHATSTRKIAASAGVSEGTVFHYFGTKNALLQAILEDFYARLTTSAREVIEDVMDTRQRLQLLAQNHVRALIENNALMIRLIQVYLSVDLSYYTDYRKTLIHELNYTYTRVFDAVIQEGIQRGSLDPDLNLPAIRDLFFGGAEYGMRTLLGHDNTDELTDYVNALVEPLWQSMQPQKAHSVGPAAPDELELRLKNACKRVEKAARRLEKTNKH